MFPTLRFLSLLSLASLVVAKTIGPSATLTVANRDLAPDGFKRATSLINGVNPAPLITAKMGDRFKLDVVNRLTDETQLRGTSIHWHGLFQSGTNFMDGAVGVNQCPIAPETSFLYNFAASQPGTFWYHSHFEVQYCDGVRGPIVIYDPRDPLKQLYDVDDESTVITLSEWYHEVAPSIVGIPMADSTLINGKGRFPGGPNVDLAVVNVQRGKRYRFRVISISCDPNFIFSIDGHQLTIIEADGISLRPHTVDNFRILAGQRYSAVLNANQPVGNYWIRALPNSGKRGLNSTFANGVNSAILRYKGARKADPTSTQNSQANALVETNLHPAQDPMAPGVPTPDGADVTFNLSLTFDPASFRFSINNQSFVPPTVPVLLQIMSGARKPEELLPEGGVLTVPKDKVVQVNMPSALIGGPHPFHLHGHAFSVVRSADSGNFNFLDPVRRDVVSIGETVGDFVSIRFKTDNPGPWILHCHIDFHLHAGLAIVFAEAPDQTTAANRPVPADWNELCPAWDRLPESVKHAQVASSPPAAATDSTNSPPATGADSPNSPPDTGADSPNSPQTTAPDSPNSPQTTGAHSPNSPPTTAAYSTYSSATTARHSTYSSATTARHSTYSSATTARHSTYSSPTTAGHSTPTTAGNSTSMTSKGTPNNTTMTIKPTATSTMTTMSVSTQITTTRNSTSSD